MGTGFIQRFKGRIAVHELWLTAGNLVDKLSGIFATPVSAQRLAMTVTAVANTDFTVSIPAGATLLRATVYTKTAFTAVTDALISIGSSAGGQTYVPQTSIAAIGVVSLSLVGAAAAAELAAPATPNLFVRITQTGGSTAVGAATLVIEYAP